MDNEELRAVRAELNASAAQLRVAQSMTRYLRRVLKNLVDNVTEDVPREVGTDHLWASVEDAEEALGYYDVDR